MNPILPYYSEKTVTRLAAVPRAKTIAKAVVAAFLLNFLSLNVFAQLPLVYSAENTGASCAAPPLPSFSQLPTIVPLPDPFLWADGRGRTTNFSDWECRRNEIRAQIENYEIGPKPTRPQNITASYAPGTTAGTGTLTVNVTENGQTLVLTSQVALPSGAGPFPAIIGMNSPSGSVPAAVFTSRNIARITFNHNQVTTYGGQRATDPYYRLYPNLTVDNMGQYSAWAWGVSRLIDGLELVQSSLPINLQRIGVTGCSYAGKMALFSGAFDERIALTIAQESGGGGAPAWRVSETLGAVEKLGATDYNWFKEDMRQFSDANVSKLPEDHHELMAMIAPRALLVTGNTDFEWLANPSAYVSARAAHEVWKQFGVADRFGFYIDGGHNHCAVPATQQPAMEAFVDKFLVGNTSVNTNITVHPYPLINYQRWYQWWGTNNPVLPPLPPEPLGKRLYFEAECATVGSGWDVLADTAAAHGAYVQAKAGLSSTAAAPTNASAHLVMPFSIDSAGTYNILGRLNVPPGDDYSYWMKIDNGAFQAVSSQLLANPGFESGLTGWTTLNSNGATISANAVAADAHSGTGSMKVVNPTAQGVGNQWRVQVSSAAFPTTIGKQYTISYWVRAAAPGGSIRLSTGPSSAQYQADQAIGTAWQQVSWTITATLASTTFLFDMGQVANTYYIDDASVKEVNTAAGWRWVKLRDAAMSVGPHTLTIAYNAGGSAKLDKVLVTSSSLTITGKGPDADNCKTQQTISFGQLPTTLLSTGSLTLTATASSGLPVTYTSSDPTVATVTNGVVQMLRLGTVTITARQVGNATYAAAPAVSQTLTIVPCFVAANMPVTTNDLLQTPTGTPITFTSAQLVANDTDPQGRALVVNAIDQPTVGNLVTNSNGSFTYTPPANYTGQVNLVYTVQGAGPVLASRRTGHYYEFVSAPNISWSAAKAAAAARTYQGMSGYLATVTFRDEQEFLTGRMAGNYWLGASDMDVEGEWRWKTGPESGTQIWKGDGLTGWGMAFTNWATGQPDDFKNQWRPAGEDYAVMYGQSGLWNDLDDAGASAGIAGYVVEYGGMEACLPYLYAIGGVAINVGPGGSNSIVARNSSNTAASALAGNALQAYPNPNGGDFRVRLSAPVAGLNQVDLFDLQGRLVKSLLKEELAEQEVREVAVTGLNVAAGLYQVRLLNAQGVHYLRVSIQK